METEDRSLRPNPGSTIVLPASDRARWVLLVWGACLAYAILRYNVIKGVEWMHLPLYTVNKSVALAGILFLALAYLTGKKSSDPSAGTEHLRARAKFLGLTGFSMLSLHVLMGVILLSSANYEKFFDPSGTLNWTGELTFLFGVLAYGCLLFPAITTLPYMYDALGVERWQRSQRLGYLALTLGCGHTFTMGYKGWFDLSTWPGWLPPITLLGFLAGLLAISVKLVCVLQGRSAKL